MKLYHRVDRFYHALVVLILAMTFTSFTCVYEEGQCLALAFMAGHSHSQSQPHSLYLESDLDAQVSRFIRYYEPLVYHLKFSPLDERHLSENQLKGSLHLSFTAFGKSFNIRLNRQSRIFAKGATVQVINSHGLKSNTTIDSSHLYQGYVEGETGSTVHGHIISDIFYGIIKMPNESFHLEPAWYYFNISSPYHSIIYKESDVVFPSRNGTTNFKASKSLNLTRITPDNLRNILSIQHQNYQPLDIPIKDTNIFGSLYFNHSNLMDFYKQKDTSGTERSTFASYSYLKKRNNLTQGMKKPVKELNGSAKKVSHLDKLSNPSDMCDNCSGVVKVRTCNLYIVIDHTFFLSVASDFMHALGEVAYHIEEADTTFRATDFNGDGTGDNVGLSIAGVTIFENSKSENYLLAENYNQADEYLSQFALYNFDAYCLGVAFTSVDFDRGVLGLAWVGYASAYGPPGGICQQRVIYREDRKPSSLNTAVVTTTNYGNKVPRQVTSITVMHEIAHAFGSLHDPETKECAPGGSYGNYIMFAKATDGDKPFNVLFSPCSTSEMAPVIAAKGPMCFQFFSGPYCGNRLVEDGEECDCGTIAQCMLADRCCTPQGGLGGDKECTFTRQQGSICSPYASNCCTDDCKLIAPSAKHVCLKETECTEQSLCNGESMDCPEPQFKPNSTQCGVSKTCLNGICQLGICSTLGFMACVCVENADKMCQICCQVDDSCLPVSSIASDISNVRQPVGSACNNYTGYCDANGNCIMVDSDSALQRLKELFTKNGVNDVGEWMQVNWYYAAAVLLGLVLVCALIKILHHHIPYKSLHITERAARLSDVWEEARRQKDMLADERQRITNMHSHRSLKEDISTLEQLFPSAGEDIITEAMQASINEKEAVFRLLAKGFEMKTVTVAIAKI